MTEIRFYYDRESDMLEVLFEKPAPHEQAIELNFNIVLFLNSRSGKPVNLTILDYQHLLEMEKIPLDNFQKLPALQQRRLRDLILREPVNRFLHWVEEPRLKKPHVRILSPEVRQLLAA